MEVDSSRCNIKLLPLSNLTVLLMIVPLSNLSSVTQYGKCKSYLSMSARLYHTDLVACVIKWRI